ncbi:MAG: hypothetical protein JNK29_19885 [Anaerolineales bacterium]|nr:hypothetical protein [Anaerolineales bacterium]
MKPYYYLSCGLLLSLALAGCAPAAPPSALASTGASATAALPTAAQPAATDTAAPSPTATVSATPTSEPTATWTATPVPPSPTPPATPTPLAGKLALYTFTSFEDAGGVYAAWDPDARRSLTNFAAPAAAASGGLPEQARHIAFANYAPLAAYLVARPPAAQLWITDLALSAPRLILDDPAGATLPTSANAWLELRWSADDRHLFVRLRSVADSFVVDVLTGERAPWPWRCTQVAVSPRSGRLAEWCQSQAGGPDWAVVEWGGAIWVSEQPPAEPVVGLAAGEAEPRWVWSADGAQVAYFAAAAARADVYLAEAGGARLLAEQVYNPGAGAAGLIWSQDGRRLMLRRDAVDGHTCPLYRNPMSTTGRTSKPPCWQVLETTAGQTLWSLGDSAERAAAFLQVPDLAEWQLEAAHFSPDGRRAAVLAEQFGFFMGVIVDVDTGEPLGIFPGPVEALSWGLFPETQGEHWQIAKP